MLFKLNMTIMMLLFDKILTIIISSSYLDNAFPRQFGFQNPGTKIMEGIINLHHYMMFFIIIILVFVFSLIFLILQLFSFNNQLTIKDFLRLKNINNVNISHCSSLEIIWILIPSIILVLIAIPSFSLLYAMDAFNDSYILLNVVGHQWYWSYECVIKTQFLPIEDLFSNRKIDFLNFKHIIYKFDSYLIPTNELKTGQLRLLETTNPVVLPVDTGIKVLITADDVIHSWAIPALGVKMDAVPGRLNQVFLKINRLGHFYGQCSEICGVNHGFMPISIYSVELDDFFRYVNFVTKSIYNNMYLKHFFLRNSFLLDNTYSVLIDSKISRFNKTSLFSQIFFELILCNFNTLVKKY